MKKKGFIIIISVLLILIILSLVTKYIDTANVTTGHEPKCCIKIVSQDGNRVTYWGLGYKVVRYVGVSPKEPYKNNIGVKMGSWFMKYEKPTNVVLDVKAFETNNTFKISEKADVDFITNLLKNSKYINEPCDGISNYAITYDNYTYDILLDCSGIKRGNKQAKIEDKDKKELERILVNAIDEWGITLYADDVTPTGLTLKIKQFGGNPSGTLEYGAEYTLETFVNEEWQAVETKTGAPLVWNLLAYCIKMNDITEMKIDWEYGYGKLKPGYYRLCKKIMDFRTAGAYDEKTYEVYFTIK